MPNTGDIRKPVSGAVALSLLTAGCALPPNPVVPATVHPRLEVANSARVPASASLVIVLDLPVDPALFHLSVAPAAPIQVSRQPRRVVVAPIAGWAPDTRYAISLAPIHDATNHVELSGWRGTFRSQPPLAVAGFSVDGAEVAGVATVTSRSMVSLRFPRPMRAPALRLLAAGQPVAPEALSWSADGKSVSLPAASFAPGQSVELAVDAAVSVEGDVLTEPAHLRLTVGVVEPSNWTSGITPGFTAGPPVEVVVENSGPARPQAGLQGADLVYEYISEYSITRMTAIYFNRVPPLIGPVRSCRMINIPLTFAFHGVTMCSGASDGTLGQLWQQGVPVVINDYDRGGHFFRSGSKVAPHNLYTSGDRAERFRGERSGGAVEPLLVDPAHADVPMGQPADSPTVGLHAVRYQYDGNRQLYVRYDHGAPFLEAGTRAPLNVKTVIIVHAPFRDAGWVEDIHGGAHSIIYDLAGSGPAEVYSDGLLTGTTWHMAPGLPMYFADVNGQVLRLNTGLTWIHVVGNGQSR
ncbi:MAG: DUF3048 domain-containing protein [Candidatus Dormibacteraeota bacterium]|nr:DUF3048 domain-containing protein [Candidatus Dormibacteraeota bacterium]